MKIIPLTLLYMVILAASCRKEVPVTPPPTPVDKSKPTLLWKTPFTSGTISFEPQVYQSNVIFSVSICPEPLYIKTSIKGKLLLINKPLVTSAILRCLKTLSIWCSKGTSTESIVVRSGICACTERLVKASVKTVINCFISESLNVR